MALSSLRFGFICLLVLSALALTPNRASAASSLSEEQRQEIEKLVHKYIMDHPEVIIETIDRMQARQEQAKKQHVKKSLISSREMLLNNPSDPVGGNPKGDVTVVEFFDYRCGYCKRVFPSIMKTINDDKNVRYVFKEFPILGPDSVVASKAALAAWQLEPAKYQKFHKGLMSSRGNLPKDKVLKIAAEAGLNIKDLTREMESSEVEQTLRQNHQLAQALNITGTPAFIIGDEVIPGAVDLNTLKNLIAKARGN